MAKKIGIFSIRKGVGQTTTGLNICGMISKMYPEEKALYIDTNTIYKDVETYLTDTTIVPGIDEFNMYNDSDNLTIETFQKRCTKDTAYNISLMAGPTQSIFNASTLNNLFPYVDEAFDVAVLESNSFTYEPVIRDGVDKRICILTPNMKSIEELKEWLIKHDKEQYIFVFDKYMERFGRVKNNLTKQSIYNMMKALNIDEDNVFILPFDMELENEANNHSILNYIHSHHNRKSAYIKELTKLITRIKDDSYV